MWFWGLLSRHSPAAPCGPLCPPALGQTTRGSGGRVAVGCFTFYGLRLLIGFFVLLLFKSFALGCIGKKTESLVALIHVWCGSVSGVMWTHLQSMQGHPGSGNQNRPCLIGVSLTLLPGTGWLQPRDMMFPGKGEGDACVCAKTPSMGNTYLDGIFLS